MAVERRRNGGWARRWRQYRTLAVLMLLAAAVLGYWAKLERPSAPSGGAAAGLLISATSLPDQRSRMLDQITIEQAGAANRSEFSLQRRRTGPLPGFYLLPSANRADDALTEGLLSALVSAPAQRRILGAAATADGRRSYRVDDGECRIRVRFAPDHTLCFGAESPTGSVYVRQDHSPDVLLVDGELYSLLSRPPESYRARRIAVLPLPTAHQIELGSLRLSHDGELWRVQASDGGWALAEPAQVDALVRRLADWQVKAFSAGPPPPAAAPQTRFVVDGIELLRGGWPCPQGDPGTRLFVRGDSEWLCANEPAAHSLQPAWSELQAQRLIPIATGEVARLHLPSDLAVVQEPDGTYSLSGHPAETASVRQILTLLTQARADAETASALPPATAVRVVVTTVTGQVITLQLWQSGAQIFMQRDREKTRRVDQSVRELLAISALTFAPRQLLMLEPAAATQAVTQAVTQIDRRGTTHEVLIREAGWHLREPTVAPADSTAVAALLQDLAELRAERWVAATSRQEFGLHPPRLRLSLLLRNQPELGLLVGAPANDRGDCYAQRLAGGPIAVLAAPSCATLLSPLVSPLLLRLDEARLIKVELVQHGQPASSLLCTHAQNRWQCGGLPLTEPLQRTLLAALQGLQHGESPSYAAPLQPLRLTVHLTHSPLHGGAGDPLRVDSATLGEEVAPSEQTLLLYAGANTDWSARLADRAVTYRVPAPAAQALISALAAAQTQAP